MYKSIVTKKFKVGAIFPRVVLYSRRNTIGFSLIKPKTVVAMLAMKLHIRNMRVNTRNNQLIRLNEEAVMVKYRYGKIEWKERKSENETM